MEAKSSSSWSFNLSGTSLLVLLSIVLGGGAIAIDWTAHRLPWQVRSLTLPLCVCAVVTSAVGYWVVPLLVRLKTGQIIRDDGPQAHLKKAGTPTMGGVFFIPVAVLAAAILSGFAADAIAVGGITLGYGFILARCFVCGCGVGRVILQRSLYLSVLPFPWVFSSMLWHFLCYWQKAMLPT